MNESLNPKDEYSEAKTITQRPIRQKVISQDDILNLIIALETSKDMSEILEDEHIFDN
jgi:hypothetical protein|tara:strand:+ start:1634 stop:1807 length:174 start_codon:yes stop_codon:yes gene_type:complete